MQVNIFKKGKKTFVKGQGRERREREARERRGRGERGRTVKQHVGETNGEKMAR